MGSVQQHPVPAPRRRLVFGVDVRCSGCGGSGKERSQFDSKTGRWFAPKCSRCGGVGIVIDRRVPR